MYQFILHLKLTLDYLNLSKLESRFLTNIVFENDNFKLKEINYKLLILIYQIWLNGGEDLIYGTMLINIPE